MQILKKRKSFLIKYEEIKLASFETFSDFLDIYYFFSFMMVLNIIVLLRKKKIYNKNLLLIIFIFCLYSY